MLEEEELYDFSEYPLNHPCYNLTNKKVIGKFKDELNSMPLGEFSGLRPKCYSLEFNGEVKKNVVQHSDLTEK